MNEGPLLAVKDKACGYFIDDGLLVRKWASDVEFCVGSPVYQIVVPAKFRCLV